MTLTLEDYRLIVAHDILAGGGDTRTIQRADLVRWRENITVIETNLEASVVLVADDADTILDSSGHDEPLAGDWPPVIPGEFPCSH